MIIDQCFSYMYHVSYKHLHVTIVGLHFDVSLWIHHGHGVNQKICSLGSLVTYEGET